MVTQEEILKRLTDFFQKKKFSVDIHVIRFFSKFSFQWYDKIEIDLVLDNKIAIEIKRSHFTDPVQTGIGQAIIYLLFFEESWLAVPNIAIEILKPILSILKLNSFKVLDWENMELYETTKDGKVTSHKL